MTRMPRLRRLTVVLLAVTAFACTGQFESMIGPAPDSPGSGGAEAAELSSAEISGGLRQALDVAAENAVSYLGRPGGYLDDPEVRIPMPETLASAERTARSIGQDELADEFVASMNRAAEKAAPETLNIFTDAIRQMSFEDARGILDGPDDAATQYFRRTSSGELAERIRPIVSEAMNSVGVTRAYKNFIGGASMLGALPGMETADLDSYVTDSAVEGLFRVMAREELKIRENPAARTSDLLKKVFGAAK